MRVKNLTDLTDTDLDALAREGAVKLEITGGVPTWEASPTSRHQWVSYQIQSSIRRTTKGEGEDGDCACAHLADVYIRFPDGSLKRPDISIFCERPPMQDDALIVTPHAVVEIISPGYEYKDTTLNPQFYLAQKVDDVVVVDPRSGAVTHYRATGSRIYRAPVTVQLQCGCECTVPLVEDSAER